MITALWRWGLLGVDALAAVAVTAAAVLMRPVSGWWVWCLAALVGLPLAVRRPWPVAVLVVVSLAGGASLLVGLRGEVVVYAVAIALYPVALKSVRPAAWGLAGALAAVLVPGTADALSSGLPLVSAPGDMETFTTAPAIVTAFSLVVLVGAWGLGSAVRVRHSYLDRSAELRTARMVAEERLRIARDVHDVVGHALSLITMKAAVATHLGAEQDTALRTIEQVGRSALDDVRSVLTGFREPGTPDDEEGPPTLAGIDRLVAEASATGMSVTYDRDDLPDVPAGVQMSTYRIVQEALTNVRRHASATHCRITLTADSRSLRLAVVDDGTTAARSGPPGIGLLGMRERVALYGGTFVTGPEPGGGFAVRAEIPLVP
ncbi:sensor histidine kinase [Cryptosporangium sp. NPDC048952]|uniref:sensor histidine kinase n=1 Tax=Cryptosporangium sp. NPDC048952 TaxID=3363961 RepID=UPI0037165996